jgi:hypothetical protein
MPALLGIKLSDEDNMHHGINVTGKFCKKPVATSHIKEQFAE